MLSLWLGLELVFSDIFSYNSAGLFHECWRTNKYANNIQQPVFLCTLVLGSLNGN